MRGLLDTSVFIAAQSGRPMRTDLLPQESAVSVVTLAELRAGVLAAVDVETRARRMPTLHAVGDVELLGIDEAAAHTWALMRVELAGTGRRVNVNDLWIAASAASRDLPVVIQDGDVAAIERIAGLRVVRV